MRDDVWLGACTKWFLHWQHFSVQWFFPSDEMTMTLWCNHVEILSTLLALCEGNPPVTGGFPSQRVSDAGPWFRAFLCCWDEQAVQQTVELLVITDVILMCQHSRDNHGACLINIFCIRIYQHCVGHPLKQVSTWLAASTIPNFL